MKLFEKNLYSHRIKLQMKVHEQDKTFNAREVQ